MPKEMITVFRAANIGEADIVAHWLEENGVPAFVKNRWSVVTLHVPTVAAPLGVEVCVADEEDAAIAEGLLADKREELARRKADLAVRSPIQVECEACGLPSEFPGLAAGTVQSCPHCRAHVDVPEPR